MVKLSVLSENTAGYTGILGEWGWSLFIETSETTILLDTGAGKTMLNNARAMNIDLQTVDKIVLSHSHFDHTGGLREALQVIGKKEIEVIAHPDIWSKKYNRMKGRDRFMGMPFQREELESYGARFQLETTPYQISSDIKTTGEVPMNTSFEQGSTPAFGQGGRFIQTPSGPQVDPMADDMALVISTPKGLIVTLGCAHRGIINTLRHAQSISGNKKIYGVFGGAHLVSESMERIDATVQTLRDMDIQVIGLCHCTGKKAISRLITEFGDRFVEMSAGISWVLE